MIELKPLSISDLPYFVKWLNDQEVIRYSLSLFQNLNTEFQIKRWLNEEIEDQNKLKYGIYLKSTNKLLGYAGICKISKTNKSGEFYIMIGDKSSWGQGVGTATTQRILDIGFTDYDLNRIMLTVSEPNKGAVRAYEKAGFKLEGRLREAAYRDGIYHDKFIMSILKSEWSGIN